MCECVAGVGKGAKSSIGGKLKRKIKNDTCYLEIWREISKEQLKELKVVVLGAWRNGGRRPLGFLELSFSIICRYNFPP